MDSSQGVGVFCFAVLLLQGLALTSASIKHAHVILNSSDLVIASEGNFEKDEFIAKCIFENAINETGWAYLQCESNSLADSKMQALGAGMSEGYITAPLIELHWKNLLEEYCNDKEELCARIRQFFNSNWAWIREQITQHKSQDPYWYQIDLAMTQVSGLYQGYRQWFKEEESQGRPRTPISLEDLLWLNSNEELEDITGAVRTEEERKTHQPSVLTGSQDRCSVLIKIMPDGSNLFAGHNTWLEYTTMLRMQKLYKLPFRKSIDETSQVSGISMSFSSYPGFIISGDDFYILSSGLVTTETTIGNANDSLWSNIKTTGQVPEWLRSLVANRLATGGKEWTEIFSQYNSGTLNNHWMVVDYKLFKQYTKPKNLPSNLLWVLEQIPGFIHSEDMTTKLRSDLYWASYNTPYFNDIFNLNGHAEMQKRYGDWFTYDKTPRAIIFRRDLSKVQDEISMLALLRYNNYTHDPASECEQCTPKNNAYNAIAARSDLNPANGTYPWPAIRHRMYGATDAKITSFNLVHDLLFWSQAGPTFGIDLPEFRWSNQDVPKPLGHPNIWKFEPVLHKWDP